jgi:nucleotide-binding universal stress UspA family protein
MTDNEPKVCSRCGSGIASDWPSPFEGWHAIQDLPDDPDDAGGVLRERFQFAVVEGDYVCSDCISPEEQRELAGRYIELLREALAQREAAGIDPDWSEGTLISYAQVLQERLDRLAGRDDG